MSPARLLNRFGLRDLSDRYVPPRLIARDRIVIVRFHNHDRSARLFFQSSHCFTQLFVSPRPHGMRAQTGRIGHEINGNHGVSLITILVARAESPTAASTAQAPDAAES